MRLLSKAHTKLKWIDPASFRIFSLSGSVYLLRLGTAG